MPQLVTLHTHLHCIFGHEVLVLELQQRRQARRSHSLQQKRKRGCKALACGVPARAQAPYKALNRVGLWQRVGTKSMWMRERNVP